MILMSPAQIKAANLIFNEHFELKVTNGLQRQQIENLQHLYLDELKIDSLYEESITNLKTSVEYYDATVNKQAKKLKKKEKIIKMLSSYSLGSSTLIILLLCLL